jgi:hypothetical protein
MVASQAQLLPDDDPLIQVLELWMQQERNWNRPVTAGELYDELRIVAAGLDVGFPCDSGRSIGQKLSACREFLKKKVKLTIIEDQRSHQKQYRFEPLTGNAES